MSDANRNGDSERDERNKDDFSLEEIMAEYKSDMVLNTGKRADTGERRRRKQGDTMPSAQATLFSDTRNKLRSEMEELSGEPPRKDERIKPEDGKTAAKGPGLFSGKAYEDQQPIDEFMPVPEFAKTEDFLKHFAPSDSFVGDMSHDMPEDQIEAGAPETVKTQRKKRVEAADTPKILPGEAYKSMAGHTRLMGIRCAAAAVFCLPQLYVLFAQSFGLWLPGFMQYVNINSAGTYRTYLFVSIMLLLIVMFLCIEVCAAGLIGFAQLRPGAESLVMLSCVVSALHAVSILLFPKWGGYLPYCSVASVAMFFAMWGSYLKKAALRTTYKTAAASVSPYIVWREDGIFDGGSGYLKGEGGIDEFVALCESEDGAARIYSFAAPVLIVAAIVLAALSSFGRSEPARFLWAFSAILSGAAPFSMLLCLALPFSSAAQRLGSFGAALTGWFGVRSLSKKGAVMAGDTDMFPPGTIYLNGLKILGNYSIERVISYTASMITVSGCGLANVFTELLSKQAGALRKVDNFCHYEDGGFGAEINGDRVLVGTSDFLTRMGIRMPQGANIRSAVLIAVNHELAGIFAINYSPVRSVKHAIRSLLRHRETVVLAVLDFNITPNLIKQKFKLSADVIEYPTIEERIAYSGAERKSYSKPGAVLSREGLGPFAESVISAQRVNQAYTGNIVFSILCAVAGAVIMFFMAYGFSPAAITPHNVLLFHALMTVPVLLISGWVNRY